MERKGEVVREVVESKPSLMLKTSHVDDHNYGIFDFERNS